MLPQKSYFRSFLKSSHSSSSRAGTKCCIHYSKDVNLSFPIIMFRALPVITYRTVNWV